MWVHIGNIRPHVVVRRWRACRILGRRSFCREALKENQPDLLEEARRVLSHLPLETAQATASDLDGGDIVTWWAWVTDELAGWPNWSHLNAGVRIHKVKTDKDGNVLSTEDRYYVSSLATTRLTPRGWLDLIRRRWSGVVRK